MTPALHDAWTEFRRPVWLSSVEHQRQLVAIYRDSSRLAKLTGAHRLPDGFPHLVYWLLPFVRVPIIYFANGRLLASPERMRFESLPRNLLGASLVNVRTDLCFDVPREAIQQVEPYRLDPAELPIPGLSYFNFPWTRVRTLASGIAADFLIGLGGAGPSMRGIRQRNQQLFQFLVEYAADR
jgi:hypothetical protein